MPGQTDSFCNGLLRDTATLFLDDRLPRQASGNLVKNIRYQNARPSERGFPVTDVWVGDHVPS